MIRVSSIKIKNDGNPKDFENGVMNPELLKKSLLKHVERALKIRESDIEDIEIMRHSIDARKKPEIYDIYMVDVYLKNTLNEESILKKSKNKNATIATKTKYIFPKECEYEDFKRPVVVGAGPAGLFAAYELATHGYKPILIERGADVDARQKDVEKFWESGVLNTLSNVQFGEGGAGAFSDGKLNTMVKDRDGRGRKALEIFVSHGAPKEIMYEAKPHIGTDMLVNVVKSIRKDIIKHGGDVLFETKLTDFLIEGEGDNRKIKGIIIEKNGERGEIETENVILAIGHSARDTFEKLIERNIYAEPKAFAVGLRVEHKQKNINKSQYGVYECPTLPPAPYKVVHNTSKGRGVYSFCMCPGGYVVNASSEEGRLCVNGMSFYKRDGRNANSAIIVTVKPEDFGGEGPLSGVLFQRKLEEKAYKIGNGKIPVQYFVDFKNKADAKKNTDEGRKDYNLPCCKGDYSFANVHEILPEDLNEAIIEGMAHFGRMIQGFDDDDVIMEGVEARTSSPIRISRDENLESVNLKGLYPCGEGAGYAGGIMSAAMDGMKVAAMLAAGFKA